MLCSVWKYFPLNHPSLSLRQCIGRPAQGDLSAGSAQGPSRGQDVRALCVIEPPVASSPIITVWHQNNATAQRKGKKGRESETERGCKLENGGLGFSSMALVNSTCGSHFSICSHGDKECVAQCDTLHSTAQHRERSLQSLVIFELWGSMPTTQVHERAGELCEDMKEWLGA